MCVYFVCYPRVLSLKRDLDQAGTDTSQLLSKALIPAVAIELSTLIDPPNAKKSSSILSNIKSYIWPTTGFLSSAPSDANPSHFSQAIQEAFTKLDTEITGAPVRLLAEELAKSDNKDKSFIPDLSKHPFGQAAIMPAISGSSESSPTSRVIRLLISSF